MNRKESKDFFKKVSEYVKYHFGVSYTAQAKRAGISNSSFKNYRRDELGSTPSAAEIQSLLNAFDITPTMVLEHGDEDPYEAKIKERDKEIARLEAKVMELREEIKKVKDSERAAREKERDRLLKIIEKLTSNDRKNSQAN